MPYNGAGNFVSLPPPQYPAVPGDVIRASYFNAVINDLIAGLTNAVTRDGQSPATSNLPMAGKKHTGVADGVALDEYASIGQLIGSTTGKGAALLGFGPTVTYGSGTVGNHITNFVNAEDFGAKFDNVTDDTAAWNAAVTALGTSGGTVYGKRGAVSYIAGTNGILLPSNVTLDLMGGTLRGTGNGAGGNTLVNSAYYNTGTLTINAVGNAVVGACVRNGTLFQAGFGLQIRNCIDACRFENLQFAQCYNGIAAFFCLYASFQNIMYRNTSTGIAYRFSNNCNAIHLRQVYACGTNPGTIAVGFQFDNKTYATTMENCSAEFCGTGILTGELNGFNILGCYFEGITTRAIDLSSSAVRKTGVTVAGCFFSGVPMLVYGRTVNNFVWESSNYRFGGTPGSIDLQTDTTIVDPVSSVCTGVVRLNSTDLLSQNPTSAALPTWLLLSNAMRVEAVAGASASTSGLATPIYAKTIIDTLVVPMAMSGVGGASMNAGDQVKPFQNVTFSGPVGGFSVLIDTSINYVDYNFVIFRFDITDNVSTYKILGRAYGTDVFLDNAAGKTVVASNNAGKLRLTVSSFSHPSGTAAVTSLVRHV